MANDTVDDETLARWRADWREIPRDQWPVARAHGWRGPLAGWARPIGPRLPPTPRQQADLNVIEREFEQLGLDLGNGAWVLDRDPDDPTKVAFRIDSAGTIIQHPAPWDRPGALGIITLSEHGQGRDRWYTSSIQVWNIHNNRLADHGWSVLDYEGPASDDPYDPQRVAWYLDEALAENPYQAIRRAVTDLVADGTPGVFDVGRQPTFETHPTAGAGSSAPPSATAPERTSNAIDGRPDGRTAQTRAAGSTTTMDSTADVLGPPPSPCDYFGLPETELTGSTVYRHGWKLVVFTERGHITTRWIPDQFRTSDAPRCFDEAALIEWLDGSPGEKLEEEVLPTDVREHGWYLTTVGEDACRDRSPDPAVRAGRRTKRTVGAVGGALTIMAAIGFCAAPDDDTAPDDDPAADAVPVDEVQDDGDDDTAPETPDVSADPNGEDTPDDTDVANENTSDAAPESTDAPDADDPEGATSEPETTGDGDPGSPDATADPAWETLGVLLPGPITLDPVGGQSGSTNEEWRQTPIVDIVEHTSWVVDVEGDAFDALFGENGAYACGASTATYRTTCPVAAMILDPGAFVVSTMRVDAPIQANGTFLEYGLAFDVPGAANYRGRDPFPLDMFNDAEHWYRLTIDPDGQRRMFVDGFVDGVPGTPIHSSAVVVESEDRLMWLVPIDELAPTSRQYRMTAFSNDLGPTEPPSPATAGGDVTGLDVDTLQLVNDGPLTASLADATPPPVDGAEPRIAVLDDPDQALLAALVDDAAARWEAAFASGDPAVVAGVFHPSARAVVPDGCRAFAERTFVGATGVEFDTPPALEFDGLFLSTDVATQVTYPTGTTEFTTRLAISVGGRLDAVFDCR